MADIDPLRRILNNTPASAVDLDYNYQVINSYLDASVVQVDGSKAMTSPLTLSATTPTADNHAVRVIDLANLQGSDWAALTLLNSWVDYGGGYQGAEYRKVGDVVQLRGVIKNGTTTSGTDICILPVGHRPPASILFGLNTSPNAVGLVQILTDGTFEINSNIGSIYTMLNVQFSVIA